MTITVNRFEIDPARIGTEGELAAYEHIAGMTLGDTVRLSDNEPTNATDGDLLNLAFDRWISAMQELGE